MLNVEDYFARKRAQLGFERMDVLAAVQATLDEWLSLIHI